MKKQRKPTLKHRTAERCRISLSGAQGPMRDTHRVARTLMTGFILMAGTSMAHAQLATALCESPVLS